MEHPLQQHDDDFYGEGGAEEVHDEDEEVRPRPIILRHVIYEIILFYFTKDLFF